MRFNQYIIAAVLSMLLVLSAYVAKFYFSLGYKTSNNPEVWGQFGDYIGGIINPLFSFISIVLLIKSLTLQNEANITVRNELKNSERTEKLRTFEILFFNMINSQKSLFETLRIDECMGVEAVLKIEDEIEKLRKAEVSNREIKNYLEGIDIHDQIFGLSRSFYIMVQIITEKLSNSEGFSAEDRRAHFKALVNFTDFSQLRLILICIQFMDFQSTNYLRSSIEFKTVIEELGMSYELY